MNSERIDKQWNQIHINYAYLRLHAESKTSPSLGVKYIVIPGLN
jgi:hypothetical protein